MTLIFTKDLIENFKCFSTLTDSELLMLERNTEHMTVGIGNHIFHEGELCQKLYFLTEGSVVIRTKDEDGKEHINSIEHRYSVFGECCLFGMPEKTFTAIAINERTSFFAVDIDIVRALMKSNFAFNMALINLIGQKVKKSNDRLSAFATKDARARIVEFLKENAEEVGRQVGYETLVKHGLTQQDIAVFTGTSRQTVTTVLNDLKKSNQIYLRRKSILIRDVTSLN